MHATHRSVIRVGGDLGSDSSEQCRASRGPGHGRYELRLVVGLVERMVSGVLLAFSLIS